MTASLNEGHRKRLRERFAKASLEGFHDYEVLELLLTFAIPRKDVKPLAKELIREFKGLQGVFDAGVDGLSSVNGIGESAAVLIALLRETARVSIGEQTSGRARHIRTPEDVFAFLEETIGEKGEERLIAVYLNSKNE